MNRQNNMTVIDLKNDTQFKYEYITHNRVIKLYQDEERIVIGRDSSVNVEFQNELKYLFKKIKVEFKTLTVKEFDDLLREISDKKDNNQIRTEITTNREDLTKLASDAPIINLVNDIILKAVESRCSDIHFEANESFFRVRYRLNGYLNEAGTYPINLYDAVSARLKVISKLDITQKRLAQDGKALLSLYEKKIDIRTSTLPTIYGESIVLRLLGVEDTLKDLESLGFEKDDIDILKRIIQKNYGAFILTGPTGSGKTTTLRCLLNHIDKKSRNIITIEDPVEYTVEGVNQVQINEKIGFGFSTILRNILRQDPDVIMIGEMRDLETSDLALRSAMTGHLVLSTLHTNDSISAITRLINIGIEPYVIESSLLAAAAQRLVRVLCPECKEKYNLENVDLKLLERYNLNSENVYKPVGCSKCNNTGFKGRVGIFEIFELDENIHEMIVKRDSITFIRKYLKNNKFKSILEKGLLLASKGNIYLDEIKGMIGEVR